MNSLKQAKPFAFPVSENTASKLWERMVRIFSKLKTGSWLLKLTEIELGMQTNTNNHCFQCNSGGRRLRLER
jgi:hypothetical protein